jgi:hypothetical protein
MMKRWFRQDLPAIAAATLCLLVATTGAAEARGGKWRAVPMSSTPKVVVPPSVPAPTVTRSTPAPAPAAPAAAPAAPAAAPSTLAAASRAPLAPMTPAAAAPRDSFMSGLTGGLVGVVIGKSIARSFNSPEAWAGLVMQLLLFAGLAFLLFKLVMGFSGSGAQPAFAAAPARANIAPDRLSRVIDRQR